EPLGIESSDVAGAQVAVDETLADRLVAAGIRRADPDLAHLAGNHVRTSVVEDADVDAVMRAADRAQLVVAVRAHVLGRPSDDLAAQFGLAVAVHDADAELPLERSGLVR